MKAKRKRGHRPFVSPSYVCCKCDKPLVVNRWRPKLSPEQREAMKPIRSRIVATYKEWRKACNEAQALTAQAFRDNVKAAKAKLKAKEAATKLAKARKRRAPK